MVCDWLINWRQARRLIGELVLEVAPIGRAPHIRLEARLDLAPLQLFPINGREKMVPLDIFLIVGSESAFRIFCH